MTWSTVQVRFGCVTCLDDCFTGNLVLALKVADHAHLLRLLLVQFQMKMTMHLSKKHSG